ncbi:MAG: hypothetical protein CMJ18_17610 [Phycisphaeraceae bacterium]|nr:hypothetical protein [Phycisphaeraceae bacterium]
MRAKPALRATALLVLIVAAFLVLNIAVRGSGRATKAMAPLSDGPPYISELPQIWTTPRDYEKATGKRIATFRQSPYLDEAVASGRLPPVEQRLPDEPLVVHGVQGIGRYGGIYIEASPEKDGALEQNWLPHLMWWKHDFQKPYLNLVKAFDRIDADGREYVMKLRKGLKWSDGHPYTADDILFLVYDVAKYAPFEAAGGTPNSYLFRDIEAERIDDYTVRWRFGKPRSPMSMSSIFYLAGHYPAHWLKQFHPRYVGAEKVDRMVRDEGFDTVINWFNHHLDHYHQHDLDKPSLDAWVTARFAADGFNVGVFKRNPYYFAVDPEGNQLPYMDERHVVVTSSKAVAELRALNGDLSFYHMPLRNYVLAKRAEKAGKVRVHPWTRSALNLADIQFNVTHPDPVIRALYRDRRFKFGVSHAIDRKRISELLYHGLGEPWQVAPYEDDPFYHERLARTALAFDPEKANALLDESGLDRRDEDGLRRLPDGRPLVISLLSIQERMDGVAELIVDDLRNVGVRMVYRPVDPAARSELHQANRLDAVLWHDSYGTNGGTFMMWQQNAYIPEWWGCNWAPLWQQWFHDSTKGQEPNAIMLEALDHFDAARSTLSLEENRRHWKAILDIAADNLWSIGTLRHPGDLAVLAPYMRNVPRTRKSILRGDWGRQDVWWIDEERGAGNEGW